MSKRTCKRGHTRTPENTVERFGIRTCLDCEREKARPTRRRKARKALTPAEATPRTPEAIYALERAAAAVIINGQHLRRVAEEYGVGERALAAEAWARAKDLTRLRDGDQCWRCGAYGHHDVHHRRGRGSGGTSDPRIGYGLANLILLDRACHQWAEANFADAAALGLRVSANADPADTPIYSPQRSEFVLLTHRGTITRRTP